MTPKYLQELKEDGIILGYYFEDEDDDNEFYCKIFFKWEWENSPEENTSGKKEFTANSYEELIYDVKTFINKKQNGWEFVIS